MINPRLSFGDVFCSKGIDYVFICDDGDARYAAKIRSVQDSQEIIIEQSRRMTLNTPGSTAHLERKPYTYCYVTLGTHLYINRIAHFARYEWPMDDLQPWLPRAPLELPDKMAILDYLKKDSFITGRIHKLIAKIRL